MLIWIIPGAVLLLIALVAIGFSRVNTPRRVGIEGIENQDVIKTYNRIIRWPQFRFLRRLVVSEIKRRRPKGTLVDIGCGPGYLIAVVAKSLP